MELFFGLLLLSCVLIADRVAFFTFFNPPMKVDPTMEFLRSYLTEEDVIISDEVPAPLAHIIV